jgi:hypothetical protein
MLLAGTLYFQIWPPAEGDAVQSSFQSAFHRLSIVMAALWLAHPQLVRFPVWILLASTVAIILVLLTLKARTFVLAIPILVALWITRTWQGPRSAKDRRRTKADSAA